LKLDLVIVTFKGINAVLSGSKFQEYYSKHKIRGRIMLFNMEKPGDGVKELRITGNNFDYKDFFPHGISVLEDKGSFTNKYNMYIDFFYYQKFVLD
jgi:hypothetical protein